MLAAIEPSEAPQVLEMLTHFDIYIKLLPAFKQMLLFLQV